MKTKACRKCEKHFPEVAGFYAKDSTCKECRKQRVRQNRLEKIEYYKAYDAARANDPARIAARISYSKTLRGRISGARAKQAWAEQNPIKRSANSAVNNAVRDGKLTKSAACDVCAKTNCRINGHHDDYSKPLDVRWLCSACHRAWHKKHGEAKNGSTQEVSIE